MIDRNMFCKLKVVVDFLRTVVCLLLSRPFVKRKQHKVMKELTKNKNKVNLIPDRLQANLKDNLWESWK